MKTLKQVTKEIKDSEEYIKNNLKELTDSQYKKERKKIEFLKSMLLYLETNPNKEFLKQEQERLKKLISSKESQFEYWRKNVASPKIKEKNLKSTFNSEIGITEFKNSLKTINYLLS